VCRIQFCHRTFINRVHGDPSSPVTGEPITFGVIKTSIPLAEGPLPGFGEESASARGDGGAHESVDGQRRFLNA
jgi:hypothetical protein